MKRLFKPFKAFSSIVETIVCKEWNAPDETIITQSDILPYMSDCDFANNPYNAVLGVDGYKPLYVDFSKISHLLIAGTTGSGKTTSVVSIITSLLCKCSPDMIELYICDPKRVDYKKLLEVPHFKAYSTTIQGCINLLQVVETLVNERFKAMQEKNVVHYRDIEVKPVLVFIDEANYILSTKEGKKYILPMLERLLAISRASDAHFILIGQNAQSQAGISTAIKLNINNRVAFHVMNKRASVGILEASGAEILGNVGEGLYLDNFGNITRFNGCYFQKWQVEAIVNHWKNQI